MFKRALIALALVGMVATPAAADLLVPDATINGNHVAGIGTIGVIGASLNGNPIASPGFLGGSVASQVSIPANASDTIVVTFAFHWPYTAYFARPYLGVQFQTRLNYDNSEVQILGATGAGAYTAVNFGIGPNNSKMVATAGGVVTALATQTISGGTLNAGGLPVKGFLNPSAGIISTAPGFGRFAMNPPNTVTGITQRTSGGGFGAGVPVGASVSGQLLNFSSTFPIMKVTLRVKSQIQDGVVDLWLPPSSAGALFFILTTSTSVITDAFNMTATVTVTNTFADTRLFGTGGGVATTGAGGNNSFGVSVVPEPASAALMGIGLFSLVGGFWRRRRRMSC